MEKVSLGHNTYAYTHTHIPYSYIGFCTLFYVLWAGTLLPIVADSSLQDSLLNSSRGTCTLKCFPAQIYRNVPEEQCQGYRPWKTKLQAQEYIMKMDDVICHGQLKTTPDDQLHAGKGLVDYTNKGGHLLCVISFRRSFGWFEAVALTSLRKNRNNVLNLEPPASLMLALDADVNTEAEEKRWEGLPGGNKNTDTFLILESWRCSGKIGKEIWEEKIMGVILGCLLSGCSYQGLCQALRKQW